ncbi:MAG: tellurite resistance TerB family protein [Alphaproteobacteria bacterium]
MIDATRLLGGLIGGALPGTASKALRRTGRQSGPSSVLAGAGVPGGALGLIGGLAIAAYEHYAEQQRQGHAGAKAAPPPPPGRGSPPPPPPRPAASAPAPQPGPARAAPPPPPGVADAPVLADDQAHAMLLIQAMIAAAKADGAVDAAECQRILGRLEEAGASSDERAWVMTEMARPLDVAPLIEQARHPRVALEVYAASLMAIDVDTDEERRYLADLRDRLRIDPATAADLHETVGLPPV